MNKFLYILALLVLFVRTGWAQSIPFGGKNATVEVLGAIRADSVLQLPWGSTAFKNKGADTTGRLFVSTTDSLPWYMRRSALIKLLTAADSAIYIPQDQKAIANGVASLDGTGKVPVSELPSITSSGQVFIDNSQAAMLGHAGATAGAFSVRTDSSNELFVLVTTPSSVRANWVATTYTNAVLAFGPSGNLRTGVVNPMKGDYITDSVAEGVNNLYFTAARAQTQIWLDTVSKLATQYYVSQHSATNLQALLIGGDSTTLPIALLSQLNKTWNINNGFNAITALTNSGLGTKFSIRDSNFIPYTLIGSNVDGYQATFHVAGGKFGLTPNKQASFYAYANDSGYAYCEVDGRLLGSLFNAVGLDSAHIYRNNANGTGFNSIIGWNTLTANRFDTIPNKSGTFALTSDVSGLTIDGVLTNGPNTNQNINIGKKVSGFPLYRNVVIGLNGSDSSGAITLLDTAGSNTVILSTGGSDASVLASGSSGLSQLDALTGVSSQNGLNSIFLTAKNLNFFDSHGKYLHANDSAMFSIVPLKIGKLTSVSRQFGSIFVGLSGAGDSSGKVVVQDTANATSVTVSTASASAQVNCVSSAGTTSASSTTGLTSFHLVGNGGNPTIQAGVAAGTGPTVSISGSDLAGYITITTGTSATTGSLATITFAATYGTAPHAITIQAANANAVNAGMPYVDQAGISATTFQLTKTVTGLVSSTTYQYYYTVVK